MLRTMLYERGGVFCFLSVFNVHIRIWVWRFVVLTDLSVFYYDIPTFDSSCNTLLFR